MTDIPSYAFTEKQLKWLENDLRGTIHSLEMRMNDRPDEAVKYDKELKLVVSIYNLIFGGIEYAGTD